jgi:hypothetical protein
MGTWGAHVAPHGTSVGVERFSASLVGAPVARCASPHADTARPEHFTLERCTHFMLDSVGRSGCRLAVLDGPDAGRCVLADRVLYHDVVMADPPWDGLPWGRFTADKGGVDGFAYEIRERGSRRLAESDAIDDYPYDVELPPLRERCLRELQAFVVAAGRAGYIPDTVVVACHGDEHEARRVTLDALLASCGCDGCDGCDGWDDCVRLRARWLVDDKGHRP